MKFLNTFLSIKKKWIKSLNDRKIEAEINQIEKIFQNYFVMTTNFEDYCNNKVNKKRQFYSIIYCLFLGLIVFKFLLTAFITDPEIWILFGDPLYLTGERVCYNLLLFLLSSISFFGRTAFIFCEYCF